jgi:hypothetical protein
MKESALADGYIPQNEAAKRVVGFLVYIYSQKLAPISQHDKHPGCAFGAY